MESWASQCSGSCNRCAASAGLRDAALALFLVGWWLSPKADYITVGELQLHFRAATLEMRCNGFATAAGAAGIASKGYLL